MAVVLKSEQGHGGPSPCEACSPSTRGWVVVVVVVVVAEGGVLGSGFCTVKAFWGIGWGTGLVRKLLSLYVRPNVLPVISRHASAFIRTCSGR